MTEQDSTGKAGLAAVNIPGAARKNTGQSQDNSSIGKKIGGERSCKSSRSAMVRE